MFPNAPAFFPSLAESESERLELPLPPKQYKASKSKGCIICHENAERIKARLYRTCVISNLSFLMTFSDWDT